MPPSSTRTERKSSSRAASSNRTGSTLRIPDETHTTLKALADETGESMQSLVALAVEQMRRQRILDMTNSAYAEMREDPAEWQAEIDEREAWDVALFDGFEEEH